MEVLNKRGIKDYFEVITTSDDCTAGKPAPDVYLVTAGNLKVNPSDCIVFEDLFQGIKAGNNAGMTTIAVRDEYSEPFWEAKKNEADYYIDSYKEIIDEIYQ